jgi:drug/metabolite transporter (DMT)-like permease
LKSFHEKKNSEPGKALLAGLLALFFWATLAPLSFLASEVPPLLKTGLGLLIGSVLCMPAVVITRNRSQETDRVDLRSVLLSVFGLLGYHALLFLSFATSPPVVANLINYLWPLLIILLAPVFKVTESLELRVIFAGLLGFFGASVAIFAPGEEYGNFYPGYISAFLAAIVWASYSLASSRVSKNSPANIGLAALISGALSLVAHYFIESPIELTLDEWFTILGLGIGPLGAAFYLWDYALRKGDTQRLGVLAFLTPLFSTTFLIFVAGESPSWVLLISVLLIASATIVGRSRKK